MDSDLSLKINGECKVDITMCLETYTGFNLSLMDNLCMDVILGQELQGLHKRVEIVYDGHRPLLKLCRLANMRILPLPLFKNLSPDGKLISVKSQRYSKEESSIKKGWLVGFNGISTSIGYLMPKPVYT